MTHQTFLDQPQKNESSVAQIIKLAIAIAFGLVMFETVKEAYEVYQVKQAIKIFSDVMSAQNRSDEEQRKIAAEKRQQAIVHENAMIDAENARMLYLSQQKLTKATAWTKFFKPSPLCEKNSATTECANEYIVAKKQFETSYQNDRVVLGM